VTDTTPAPDAAAPAPASTAEPPAAPAAAADVAPVAAAPDAETDTDAEQAVEADEVAESESDYEIELPQEVADLRNSPERLLFPASVTHAEAVKDADFAALGNPEVQVMVAAEAREVLADLGLNRTEGLELAAAMRSHDPAVPTAQAWDTMTGLLNKEFGINASEAFDRARQLVARDERVAQILSTNGLGNNPKIVLQIARAAMRNRGR
jgi:hypothetical protein